MRRLRVLSAKAAAVLALVAGASLAAVPVAEASGTAPSFAANPTSLTFQVGQSFNASISATGSPTPTIAEVGTLPAWISVSEPVSNDYVLTGTPPSGSGGNDVVSFLLDATNGVNPAASTTVEISVDQPPTITSSTNLTAAADLASSQQITASGYPPRPLPRPTCRRTFRFLRAAC